MSHKSELFYDDLETSPGFLKRMLDNAAKASERFEEDKPNREALKKEIEDKGIREAAPEAQLAVRESLFKPTDALGLERILGPNDLMPINYLSQGLRSGRSVCRISIHRPTGQPEGFGTGFLVSPTLLLTNHHVLPTEVFAIRSRAEFGFEYDEDFNPPNTEVFGLIPDRFFYSNEDLDFALVAVNTISSNGVSLSDYGYLRLTEASGKALAGETVSLIQHPRGADKHIAIRNNKVLNRFEQFIHYESDTEPGSSGSPVFNDQWDVVALHHSGVPKRNSNGKVLKKNGRIWQPGDSNSDIKWIANEGVRISSIFEHLKAKTDWSSSEISALEELGTFSRSTLSQTLWVGQGPSSVLRRELNSDQAADAPVEKITYRELLDKINNTASTESDIAPYFILSKDDSEGIDPLFEINRELVIFDQDDVLENALLLNSANWWSRAIRQARYRNKKDKLEVKTRIISEGDSWFQYPLILHDVVDHLMDVEEFAVLSFGGAGDLIHDMVAKAEFLAALRTENPDFFIVSGGGNDLVARSGIQRLINQPITSFQPNKLINRIELAGFKAQITQDFTSLFGMVLRDAPGIKILCHGYSYPIPNSGIWLGKPMEEIGIIDRQLQLELVRIIFDEVNDAIKDVAESFPDSAHYLDIRNIVPANGWYDELHPTNQYYGDVAAVFKQKILELS